MKILLVILFLLISIQAQASAITFIWDANTEPDLVGYKLYCSRNSSPPFTYTSSTNLTTIDTVQDLTTGGIYCAVTAYNTAGLESSYSNIVYVDKEEIINRKLPSQVGSFRVEKIIP